MDELPAWAIGVGMGTIITLLYMVQFTWIEPAAFNEGNAKCKYGIERYYLDGDFTCKAEK